MYNHREEQAVKAMEEVLASAEFLLPPSDKSLADLWRSPVAARGALADVAAGRGRPGFKRASRAAVAATSCVVEAIASRRKSASIVARTLKDYARGEIGRAWVQADLTVVRVNSSEAVLRQGAAWPVFMSRKEAAVWQRLYQRVTVAATAE